MYQILASISGFGTYTVFGMPNVRKQENAENRTFSCFISKCFRVSQIRTFLFRFWTQHQPRSFSIREKIINKTVYLFVPSFVVWTSDVKFCPKFKSFHSDFECSVAQTGMKVELNLIIRKRNYVVPISDVDCIN